MHTWKLVLLVKLNLFSNGYRITMQAYLITSANKTVKPGSLGLVEILKRLAKIHDISSYSVLGYMHKCENTNTFRQEFGDFGEREKPLKSFILLLCLVMLLSHMN